MSTPISKIEDPQAAGVANALLQAHLTSLDPVAARMATPSAIGVQGTSQPSRWQQRRDLKRMMYQESTEQKIVIPQRQGFAIVVIVVVAALICRTGPQKRLNASVRNASSVDTPPMSVRIRQSISGDHRAHNK